MTDVAFPHVNHIDGRDKLTTTSDAVVFHRRISDSTSEINVVLHVDVRRPINHLFLPREFKILCATRRRSLLKTADGFPVL